MWAEMIALPNKRPGIRDVMHQGFSAHVLTSFLSGASATGHGPCMGAAPGMRGQYSEGRQMVRTRRVWLGSLGSGEP